MKALVLLLALFVGTSLGISNSIVHELEKLATMHNSGSLTDSEFTQAKATLLGKVASHSVEHQDSLSSPINSKVPDDPQQILAQENQTSPYGPSQPKHNEQLWNKLKDMPVPNHEPHEINFDQHFSHLVHRLKASGHEVKLLAMGSDCEMIHAHQGRSLHFWHTLLESAGDIWTTQYHTCVDSGQAKPFTKETRVHSLQGTPRNQYFLASGGEFDIIVDHSGKGHTNTQLFDSFRELFESALRPGGLYFMENLPLVRTGEFMAGWTDSMSDVIQAWMEQLTIYDPARGGSDEYILDMVRVWACMWGVVRDRGRDGCCSNIPFNAIPCCVYPVPPCPHISVLHHAPPPNEIDDTKRFNSTTMHCVMLLLDCCALAPPRTPPATPSSP